MGTFTEQWIDISEYEQYSTDIKFRAHTARLVIFNGKYCSQCQSSERGKIQTSGGKLLARGILHPFIRAATRA